MKKSRRAFLKGRPSGEVVVCVFLRGAADALALVAPVFDERYYQLRPTLSVPRPDDSSKKEEERGRRLDDRFALHPELAPLLPAYRAKQLCIVHAVGSDDQTRSHFEAQDRMEHAGATAGDVGSGWLARHLRTRGRSSTGLSTVTIGTRSSESVRGAPSVAVLRSVDDYRLVEGDSQDITRALGALYSGADSLALAGTQALETLRRIDAMQNAPAPRATYPSGELGDGLREVARLLRADVPVEVATLDLGGWDTHFVQGQALPERARHLAQSLAAFREDLGDTLERVTVVVMTEFGRRAYENSSFGTDHGRGGVLLVLGGRVAGGRVVTEWPGLAEGELESPGDLAVTIDYRDVLAELVHRRLGNRRVAEVFPGWTPEYRGLFV